MRLLEINILPISEDSIPDNFSLELGLNQVRSILPYGDERLRIHAVGRTTDKPMRWAGLVRVPEYLTAGHFGIVPGCEFPEMLAQAGVVAMLLEYGWKAVRRLFATEMSWKATDQGEKAIQAKTDSLISIVIDSMMVECMSELNKSSRRIFSSVSGRIFVDGRQIATARSCGEGVAQAEKWVNKFVPSLEEQAQG